jgi:hypothetical protein
LVPPDVTVNADRPAQVIVAVGWDWDAVEWLIAVAKVRPIADAAEPEIAPPMADCFPICVDLLWLDDWPTTARPPIVVVKPEPIVVLVQRSQQANADAATELVTAAVVETVCLAMECWAMECWAMECRAMECRAMECWDPRIVVAAPLAIRLEVVDDSVAVATVSFV